MARSDHYIGLNEWARRLVLRKQKVREHGVRVFANGRKQEFSRWRRIPVTRVEQVGVIRGVYRAEVAKLHRYTFADGRVYEEFVQAERLSGGPCYFVALKTDKGEGSRVVLKSLWSLEEIEMC